MPETAMQAIKNFFLTREEKKKATRRQGSMRMKRAIQDPVLIYMQSLALMFH
ncbi:hypothetical protein BBO01nite_03930 [Brevibacillus borstelensis]|nr:hypothetical protein BBO01nite_03930 [Brevibacillus borstelensis]